MVLEREERKWKYLNLRAFHNLNNQIKIKQKMNATYSNSNGSRLGNTIIYESEAQRLQREADSFTKKFEHEKK